MSQVHAVDSEIVEENAFFAPVTSDLFDSLIAEHRGMLQRIEKIATAVSDMSAVGFFFDSAKDEWHRSIPSPSEVFKLPKAKASLDATYWAKTLHMTDVFDCMPQKRRDEWNAQIYKPMDRSPETRELVQTIPAFEEQTVRSTIQNLLDMRPLYLAERVDGIFTSLSGTHVTNRPEGFSKRMIFNNVWDEKTGTHNTTKVGVINDLRNVIAKMLGRSEMAHQITSRLIPLLRENKGQWHEIDGGALRIKLYQRGTAHIEVHPDIAYRLNKVLAHIHPAAIPANYRKKPVAKSKNYTLVDQPLSNELLKELGSLRASNKCLFIHSCDRKLRKELVEILESIGGSVRANSADIIEFDYDPTAVINEVCTYGLVPDRYSHQFYSSTDALATAAVDLADIEDTSTILEPSAGVGGIAKHLPASQTKCIEVAHLRCMVLEKMGLQVECRDFLSYQGESFDRIVMNPPFSEGRWQAHTQHAASLLNDGGVLVAILPSNAPVANSFNLEGFELEWSKPIQDAFKHTSVSVVLLKAKKKR